MSSDFYVAFRCVVLKDCADNIVLNAIYSPAPPVKESQLFSHSKNAGRVMNICYFTIDWIFDIVWLVFGLKIQFSGSFYQTSSKLNNLKKLVGSFLLMLNEDTTLWIAIAILFRNASLRQ